MKKFLYFLVVKVSKYFLKLFYRMEVRGSSLNECPKGVIIASNHASFYDPPIVSSSWPEPVCFIARKSLFHLPLFSSLIKALNTIPVAIGESNLKIFKGIINILKANKSVVIFPEGTRSDTGDLMPPKHGMGVIIKKTRCAVVPVYVHGSYEIWGKKRFLPRLWGKLYCCFGTPYFPDVDKLSSKEISEEVMGKIKELKEELLNSLGR